MYATPSGVMKKVLVPMGIILLIAVWGRAIYGNSGSGLSGEDGFIRDLATNLSGTTERNISMHPINKGTRRADRDSSHIQIIVPTVSDEANWGAKGPLRVKLKNTSSVALKDVQIRSSIASPWTVQLAPETVASMEPQQEVGIDIRVIPLLESDLPGYGEYDVFIEVQADYEGSIIKVTNRIVKIKVAPQTQ